MAAEKNFENRVKKFLKEQECWTLKTWKDYTDELFREVCKRGK